MIIVERKELTSR